MLSDQAERVLPYAPEAMFDLAADIERYPQFLPGWIAARIDRREGDVCYAEQTLGYGPVRVEFRSRAELHRPEWIEVTSDDRHFRRFRLFWRFEPVVSVSCRVVLAVELELCSHLLQRLVDRVAPRASGEILLALERRAREVYGPVDASP